MEESDNKIPCVTEGVFLVYCSKEVSINGAFGQCHSLNKLKPFISEKAVGKGRTHAWYLGSIDPQKTVTIVYESKEQEAKDRVFPLLFSITTSS